MGFAETTRSLFTPHYNFIIDRTLNIWTATYFWNCHSGFDVKHVIDVSNVSFDSRSFIKNLTLPFEEAETLLF